MIVIAIIGILAAIALPAYASYMKKAKFTEVFNVAESVKTPISLCIQEHGITQASKCTNNASGFGWAIKAADDYKTKYVASVAVTGTSLTDVPSAGNKSEISTITVTPQGDIDAAAKLVLKGYWTAAGQLTWEVDANESGCDDPQYELCVADTAASTGSTGSTGD